MNKKGIVLAVLLLGLVGASLAAHAASNKSGVSTSLANDIQQVQSQVGDFQTALGSVGQGSDGLVNLASTAQTTHSNLDSLRQQLESEAPGGYGGPLYTAANELKNAVGAVGAYINNPNADTLVSFKNQYDQAISDWNSAVQNAYAHASHAPPPTLGT